jgi:hypothetical protein
MLRKVSKKLEVTKGKASKHWQRYRTEKKYILGLKRMPIDIKKGLLAEARGKTRADISTFWDDYRGYKFSAVHKSDIPDLAFTRQRKFPETISKYYKIKKDYDSRKLNKLIPDILNKPKSKGVLLTFKIWNEEEERIQHVSEFYTKAKLQRLDELGISIYDSLSEKLSERGYVEYALKSMHIRIIYEKDKKG